MRDTLKVLEREITSCERCERLRRHCAEVARVKRRAYRGQQYWGRPVAGFGDPAAGLYILGLAPGAHGANRTGRVFTGDRSGDWLYRALWQTGFANQPASTHRGDGLELKNAWIGASVRCAPPDNKPLPEELAACRPYVARELRLLKNVRVVVALGRLAFASYLAVRREAGARIRPGEWEFRHGALHDLSDGGPRVITSYHPSQQNTSTRRLTEEMLRAVFEQAASFLEG
jgi:uracil-DNA glycosylase family 4